MNKYENNIQTFIEELGVELEESQELFSNFMEEIDRLADEMEESIAEKRMDKLGQTLHSIKGLTANFYISDIHDETATFEAVLKENKNMDINFYKDSLKKHIKEAQEEIKSFFKEQKINL